MSKTSTVSIELLRNDSNLLTLSYTEVISVNKSDPMFWTVEFVDNDDKVKKVSLNKSFIFRFTQHDNEQPETSND
jgi:hypothetical protein